MATLMKWLGVRIPTYVRTDRLLLAHKARMDAPAAAANGQHAQSQQQQQQQEGQLNGSDGSSNSWGFTITLSSVHGERAPLPMVESAQVSFYNAADLAAAQSLQQANGTVAAAAAGHGVEAAAAAAAPSQPLPVDVSGLQQVLPPVELSGSVPWRVERVGCPGTLQAVAAVVRLQLVEAADEGLRQQQVGAC